MNVRVNVKSITQPPLLLLLLSSSSLIVLESSARQAYMYLWHFHPFTTMYICVFRKIVTTIIYLNSIKGVVFTTVTGSYSLWGTKKVFICNSVGRQSSKGAWRSSMLHWASSLKIRSVMQTYYLPEHCKAEYFLHIVYLFFFAWFWN